MKVLLADKLSPVVRDYLINESHEIMEDSSLKGDTLMSALQSFQPNVLVVRSTKVTGDHIKHCPSLSLVIRAGAGVNTIDLDIASQRGVFVANCPGRNAVAVAELVMGHMLNWDRHLFENIQDFRNGVWNKKAHGKATGLLGQTIAVLGAGAIGQEVITRAKSFGLNIRCWSRSLTPAKANQLGVTYASTPVDACQGADIITVHLPSVPATEHFINDELLNAMNDNGFVINTSRNSLLDESALLNVIQQKNIKAGLDVFDGEPGSSDNTVDSILQSNPNVYVTHHIGASTDQATLSVGENVVEIIDAWNKSGTVLNCVNLKRTQTASCCLSVRHADKVGVLATILDQLKSEGHNIQEMENIIFDGGHAACARISLVSCPSTSLIQTMEQHPDIYACSLSNL